MAGNQIIHWPSWYFGPNGESKICHSISDVPDGWRDSPDHPDLTPTPEPPPPDGPNAWAGHYRNDIIAALRKGQQKIRAFQSTRALFEQAVASGCLPGYGKPSE